ncbi:hypothetical protein Naga_102732g1, partial [Nannochloropsis gaditana]
PFPLPPSLPPSFPPSLPHPPASSKTSSGGWCRPEPPSPSPPSPSTSIPSSLLLPPTPSLSLTYLRSTRLRGRRVLRWTIIKASLPRHRRTQSSLLLLLLLLLHHTLFDPPPSSTASSRARTLQKSRKDSTS